MPAGLDWSDLFDLEHPTRSDPGPWAQWIEPEVGVNARLAHVRGNAGQARRVPARTNRAAAIPRLGLVNRGRGGPERRLVMQRPCRRAKGTRLCSLKLSTKGREASVIAGRVEDPTSLVATRLGNLRARAYPSRR